MKRKQWLVLPIALVTGYSAMLQGGEHEHRHHEAHEHGVGQLNIAVEGNQLHMELTSPAMNIVGFEHQPRDKEQHERVEQAIAQLKAGDKLFVTNPAAACVLKESEVETSLVIDHDEHDHGEEKHEHHGEKHDHDEHGHGEEKHEHHAENHDHDEHGHHEEKHEEAHSDFSATYHFECAKAGALSDISVKLFEAFPATEELKVQLLNGSKQSAMELSAKTSKIEL